MEEMATRAVREWLENGRASCKHIPYRSKIETPVENRPSTYWTITYQTTCMMRCQMDYVFACRLTGAGVFIHSDEAWQTVTAMAAGQVDAHRVGLAVMHLGRTLINIWGQTEHIQRINNSAGGSLKTHSGHAEWFLEQLMKQVDEAQWTASTLLH